MRKNIEKVNKDSIIKLNQLLLGEFQDLKIKYEEAQIEGKPKKRNLTSTDIENLNPFHWGYHFDKVIEERGGFDVIIANPPWEVFQTDEKEFFQQYSTFIQKNKLRIEDWEKKREEFLKNPVIQEKWLDYVSQFPHQLLYFKKAKQYINQILKALEWLETNFRPYNPEKELQIGLFRVPVPKVDMRAFREGIANALIHRDYHQLGAVHVRLENQALVISNPGGLVDGITLANLLTTEPRPRNRNLADAMKRIGLVERSGRGIDSIYRGLLRFGRATPDYSGTTHNGVVLRLSTAEADLNFLRLVVEEENKQGAPLPIDSLIALAALKASKRLSASELATQIQRDIPHAKKTLERLNEIGLVQAHGNTRSRTYTLVPGLYAEHKAEYTRQQGFAALQHEQLVINYVAQYGQIKRADVIDLCRLSKDQASKLLYKLRDEGRLLQQGQRRGTLYVLPADKNGSNGSKL